eukprot:scaffold330500_cov59-Tisochrysis_lutea.AAC.7
MASVVLVMMDTNEPELAAWGRRGCRWDVFCPPFLTPSSARGARAGGWGARGGRREAEAGEGSRQGRSR